MGEKDRGIRVCRDNSRIGTPPAHGLRSAPEDAKEVISNCRIDQNLRQEGVICTKLVWKWHVTA